MKKIITLSAIILLTTQINALDLSVDSLLDKAEDAIDVNSYLNDFLKDQIGTIGLASILNCKVDVFKTPDISGLCNTTGNNIYSQIDTFINKTSSQFNLEECSESASDKAKNYVRDLVNSMCNQSLPEAQKTFNSAKQSTNNNLTYSSVFVDANTEENDNYKYVEDGEDRVGETGGAVYGRQFVKKYANGKTDVDIYSKDGILSTNNVATKSFGVYSNDLQDVKKAYLEDDYEVFSAYDRCVKSIDFSNINMSENEAISKYCASPAIAETYLDYQTEIVNSVGVYNLDMTDTFSISDTAKAEIENYKSDNPLSLSGSSDEMMQQYSQYYDTMYSKMMNENDSSTTLFKMLGSIEKFELSFAADEDIVSDNSNRLVLPSNQKMVLLPKNQRIYFAAKAYKQQREEVLKRVKLKKKIVEKQNKARLLVQLEFFSSMNYEPSIAQKEIDEILQEVRTINQ